jgi:hypothetical protein
MCKLKIQAFYFAICNNLKIADLKKVNWDGDRDRNTGNHNKKFLQIWLENGKKY